MYICMYDVQQHVECVGEAQLLLSSECGAHGAGWGEEEGGARINSNLVQETQSVIGDIGMA